MRLSPPSGPLPPLDDIDLADKGWKQACQDDPHLLEGLNVHAGKLTYYAVGKALGIDVVSPNVIVKS